MPASNVKHDYQRSPNPTFPYTLYGPFHIEEAERRKKLLDRKWCKGQLLWNGILTHGYTTWCHPCSRGEETRDMTKKRRCLGCNRYPVARYRKSDLQKLYTHRM